MKSSQVQPKKNTITVQYQAMVHIPQNLQAWAGVVAQSIECMHEALGLFLLPYKLVMVHTPVIPAFVR